MKHLKHTLTMILGLLFGISLQGQNFVTGSNLNIGSGNSFGSNGNDTYGNAIGVQNQVEGANTLVVGYSDTVSFGSTNSFVAGAHNRINGLNSFAIGGNVKVNGTSSMGIGYFLKPGNNNCIVIGMGVKGNNNIPNKFMENNYQHTLMIGMNSTKPTLTVGPSPNDYPQGDSINKTGKVAIGDVPVPDIIAKLHIRSDFGEDAGIILEPKDLENSHSYIRMRDEKHGIEINKDGVTTIKSLASNNNGYDIKKPLILKGIVGVNIEDRHVALMNESHSLCVNGGIVTDKVSIKHYDSNWWSDYVFDPEYQLMPVDDLRKYISINRHLPDVPSETEVMENGIELGDMQSVLLKKIEELTLYLLQQQETINNLEQRLSEMEEKQ